MWIQTCIESHKTAKGTAEKIGVNRAIIYREIKRNSTKEVCPFPTFQFCSN